MRLHDLQSPLSKRIEVSEAEYTLHLTDWSTGYPVAIASFHPDLESCQKAWASTFTTRALTGQCLPTEIVYDPNINAFDELMELQQ